MTHMIFAGGLGLITAGIILSLLAIRNRAAVSLAVPALMSFWIGIAMIYEAV